MVTNVSELTWLPVGPVHMSPHPALTHPFSHPSVIISGCGGGVMILGCYYVPGVPQQNQTKPVEDWSTPSGQHWY